MPESDSAVLLVGRDDSVLTLTLNRPDSRNALSPRLIAEIQSAFAAAAADPEVAVVVLTGADPAFCAGVDLRVIGADGGWDNMGAAGDASQGGVPAGHAWAPIGKPVIGAINGAAVTGGLELALSCDILIASERATFADTHARVGMMPLWGMTVRLPEAVGFGFARRMSLSGNFIGAQVALEHGLVTEVVPHDELLPRARQLALDIASNNQHAVRTLLGSYRRIQDHVLRPQADIEATTGADWVTRAASDNLATDMQAIIERGRKQLK